MSQLSNAIESILFRSRFLLAPLYLGLVGALVLLSFRFLIEFYHLALHIGEATPQSFTLDLAGVTYSSSAGLALLLDWLRTAQQVKKQPRLRGMPADMLALARVSGLEGILPLA